MARTQAADYGDRREAVIETAARLYGEKGFLGCSVGELAEACGMSKSLLYHYFGSKEDILFEIMSGHIEALVEVAKRVGAIADPTERLTSLTHSFVHLYVGASARHKVLVNDLDKLPPERAAQIIKTERGLLDIIDGIIVETRPGLASEPSKRRALTMLYFGMINWMHTWYNPKGDQSPDRIADLVVHIFLDGLPKR